MADVRMSELESDPGSRFSLYEENNSISGFKIGEIICQSHFPPRDDRCLGEVQSQFCDCYGSFSHKRYFVGHICNHIGRSVGPCIMKFSAPLSNLNMPV